MFYLFLCVLFCSAFVYSQFPHTCNYDRVEETCQQSLIEYSRAFEFEVMGVDAVKAAREDWPYLISLQIPAENKPSTCFQHMCGAVLISPTLMLTAAHCISVNGFLSRALMQGVPSSPLFAARAPNCRHQADERIQVDYIWINPNYVGAVADIAILQLTTPFIEFNGPYINYQSSQDYNLDQPLQDLQVVGWGSSDEADTSGISRYSVDPLIEAPVRYSYGNICKQLLRIYGDESSAAAYNDQYMFCTFSQGADTCRGDSGGPIIARGDDPSMDILLGVISWGPALCRSNNLGQAPQVYTRVSEFVPWIDEMVAQVQS